jgi:TolB-like protein
VIVYQFGDWLVELELSRLRRGESCRHLEPKVLAVLGFLLENPGEVVSQQALLESVWADRIVEASAVARNIAMIRRALGDDPRQPRYIETIPKHGYRTLAPVRRQPVQRAGVRRSSGSGADVTLAVLPFDNLSGEADLRYFSDGIAEEILQAVARTTSVKVIGRSSSFQFRGADKALARVARGLGCSHVLDGSVRRSAGRVRVSAQLTECGGQTALWAERFDFELRDVFALQDQVAAAVARALAVAFDAGPGGSTIDPAAFDLYLRAKAASTQWLGACDGDLLEQAVALAPDFAQAWATLAVTRAIEFHVERDSTLSAPLRTRAIEAAKQALRLDPAVGAAYAALSITEPVCGRFTERDALIANALRVSPHDTAVLFWACRWSWAVGRLREGLAYITRACEVDPLWPQGLHQYASMLWLTGGRDEATRVWDDLIERWPDRDYLHVVPLLNQAYLGRWGRVDELLKKLDASGLDTQRTEIVRARIDRFRRWDDHETALLARELTEEVACTGTLRLYLQHACREGLTEQVYALVERASYTHLFEPGGRLLPLDFGLHALFNRFDESDALYRDPRFVKLCWRLGLCDYWVQTGRWPDCADLPGLPYDFRAQARRYAAANGAAVPP